MKRKFTLVLSCLLAFCLLASSFPFMISAAENETVSQPGYYMTGVEINNYVIAQDGYWGLATETAYNSTEDSVTVSYTAKINSETNEYYTAGKPGRAGISDISALGIDSERYPYVAIKVKMTDNTALQFGRLRWATEAVKSAKEEGTYGSSWVNYSDCASVDPVYRVTDNYQLLVFDLTKYNSKYLTGNYSAFLFDFAREDGIIAPTAVEWQSVAFFETAADAEGWYAANDGVVGNGVEGRIVTLDDGNSSLVSAPDATTTLSYENNALRVTGTGQTKIQFEFDSNNGNYEFDIADYPIIGFHVKTNGTLEKGICSAATVDLRKSGVYWKHFVDQTVRFQYAATTDWQWVFYDVGAQNVANMTGNWVGAMLWFGAWGAADVYIDEIVFVSSTDEINHIFYKSVDNLSDDITAAQSVDTTGRRSDTVAVLNSSIETAQNIEVDYAASVASINKAVIAARNNMLTATMGLKDILVGDINGDERIDILDIVRAKRYIAYANNTNVIVDNSDFNNDGETDVYELIQLRKYLLGVIESVS